MYSNSDLPLCDSHLPYCYSKENLDIHNFLTFDGIVCLDDNEMTHDWNKDKECFEICQLHRILRNKLPRTRDIRMVHALSD